MSYTELGKVRPTFPAALFNGCEVRA